jgi:SAM-dependent methyltransferase
MHGFIPDTKEQLAFGVDPRRPEKYSLRQARYYELGADIACLAQLRKEQGKRLQLLDVGFAGGVSMRYIEIHEGADNIDYHGVELQMHNDIFKRPRWAQLHEGDLTKGLPFLGSDQFDVVMCEQVLEHVHQVDFAMATLHRVLAPGGTLILGVPIFPPGLDVVRRHVVPITDRVFKVKKERGHVQAFTKRSFVARLCRNCDLEIEQVRGFRIISGGVLRPLENQRWWWNFACSVGRVVPSLCIEIQVIGKKPLTQSKEVELSRRLRLAA